jgi:hypothetical protein
MASYLKSAIYDFTRSQSYTILKPIKLFKTKENKSSNDWNPIGNILIKPF